MFCHQISRDKLSSGTFNTWLTSLGTGALDRAVNESGAGDRAAVWAWVFVVDFA